MRNLYLTILCIFFSLIASAQDPHFTQFYNNPVYLNPALSGASRASRVMMGYRTQWPNITNLTSQFIAGDFFIPTQNYNAAFGLGVLAIKDDAGVNLPLKTTNFNIAGSIEIHLGANSTNSKDETRWLIRSGVQYGYFTRKIGDEFSTLEFEDQLVSGGSTREDFANILGESVQFSDISVGSVLSGRQFWFGIAAHHLTRPNQSITISDYTDEIEKMYTKWTFHGGWETNFVNKPRSLRIESMYMKQGDNEQFIIGLNYAHGILKDNKAGNRQDVKGYTSGADLTLILGTGLRAVPLFAKVEKPEISWDAITSQLGIEFDGIFDGKNKSNRKSYDYTMSIVYSFDYGISPLKTNAAGAHEITMIFRTKKITNNPLKCKSHFKWRNRSKFPINRSYL